MLSTSVIPLYYLSSFAGLVMVVGGIWLLYKQKIYIDSESNQVTEIELPIGKFKTNLPALGLFALGFVPLIYPMTKCSEMRSQLYLKGSVDGDAFPVQVYAVVRTDSLNQPGNFNLRVPLLESIDRNYKILYVVPGQPVVDYQPDIGEMRGEELQLPGKKFWVNGKEKFKPNVIDPIPVAFQRKGADHE